MAGPRLDVLAAFNKAKAVFFYKTMTTTMVTDGSGPEVMKLELPARFASDHGEEMNQVVALVRPASCGGGEWSLLFERRTANLSFRVFVYGGGWRDFVLDNGISIGEFLVFELVDRSRLIVHVYPRDDKFGIHPRGLCHSGEEEESGLLHPPRSGNVDQKDMGQSRPSRPSSTPGKVAWDHIGFQKTVYTSLGPNYKATRLDIPALFWRYYGRDKFDGVSYTLEGPQMKGKVKAYVFGSVTNTKCVFGTGWKEFFIANKLKIGDTLVFTLTGRYQFAVSVEA